MAVMTTNRAKELAWPELSGSSQDTLIGSYVAQAEAWVAAHLGLPAYDGATLRSLEVQTYTLFPLGDGGPVLELGIQPVVSVTSIHVSTVRDYDSEALVDSGDYTLYSSTGRVVLDYNADRAAWPKGERAIKAVVTAGFSSLDAPLEMGVALVARAMWDDTQRRQAKVASKSGRGGSVQFTQPPIPASVFQMLAPYRSPLVLLG